MLPRAAYPPTGRKSCRAGRLNRDLQIGLGAVSCLPPVPDAPGRSSAQLAIVEVPGATVCRNISKSEP